MATLVRVFVVIQALSMHCTAPHFSEPPPRDQGSSLILAETKKVGSTSLSPATAKGHPVLNEMFSVSSVKTPPALQALGMLSPGIKKRNNTFGLGKTGSGLSDMHSFVIYPLDRETDVPPEFGGKEYPNPIPLAKDDRAGFPITVTFPNDTKITQVKAKLIDDHGNTVDAWLSWPERPANDAHAAAQGTSIALIPKMALAPSTRYEVQVGATIDDSHWTARWFFVTTDKKQPSDDLRGDRNNKNSSHDVIKSINELRAKHFLSQVELDADLSKGCESHARYVVANAARADFRGEKMHTELPELSGYTVEGAMAAKSSIITVCAKRPTDAVTRFLATFYHRIPLLDPNLQRVGCGMVQIANDRWIVIIDVHGHQRQTLEGP
jgi:uncharacterized protein YkwD